MRSAFLLFLLAAVPASAIAQPGGVFQATLPEKADGFRDLAECERALGASGKRSHAAVRARASERRGTVFNRAAGNLSRCEMVAGEPTMVVYPKGTTPPPLRAGRF